MGESGDYELGEGERMNTESRGETVQGIHKRASLAQEYKDEGLKIWQASKGKNAIGTLFWFLLSEYTENESPKRSP